MIRRPCSHPLDPLMYQANRHGALSHGGGHPFDRATADVAGGEDTAPVGLEHHRRPIGVGVIQARNVRFRIAASSDETVLVECESVGEPCRAGRGSDEYEQGFSIDCAAGTRPVVLYDETLEDAIAKQLAHLGVQVHLDPPTALDLVH